MSDQQSPLITQQSERVAAGRLWWVGLLAAVISAIVNALIVTIARGLFSVPPEFAPFTVPQFTFLTVAGVAGATIVFAVVGRFSKRPIRTYYWVAAVALVLSWLPDFGLLAAKPYPGTTVQTVGTLMFMHVVTAAISVGLLTTLARER
ncbi:MAG: hypothetical protein HY784_01805 [Chloroflexi bacterium]|nr:hypothetical protein [Chloroflexota bacterium]